MTTFNNTTSLFVGSVCTATINHYLGSTQDHLLISKGAIGLVSGLVYDQSDNTCEVAVDFTQSGGLGIEFFSLDSFNCGFKLGPNSSLEGRIMSASKKVTLTLDGELATALTAVSKHLGVSRSSFVNEMLQSTVIEMLHIMDSVPKAPHKADIIRARGKSLDMVRHRVDDLQSVLDNLDRSLGGVK